ncbi:hypothetical protein B0H11DRAFT_2238424 [Mycena galericulata]|nr:hypothetical protein B0H11DRAFT_2238424 [Mycena galericulata]
MSTRTQTSTEQPVRVAELAEKLTPAQDKAFKAETLARVSDEKPLDAVLQRWLNRYMPLPTKVRPPEYVAGGVVRKRVHKRAAARKARVDHLMALRAAPKTPGLLIIRRAPTAATSNLSGGVEDMKKRLEARARQLRVAELVRLREKGRACRAACKLL